MNEGTVTTASTRKVLWTEDVVRMLGIHRNTVTRNVKNGRLPPPMRLGKRLFWTPDAFWQFLEERRTRPVALAGGAQ